MPAYELHPRDDGSTAVVIGDLVIGTVRRDGQLYVGRHWTSMHTMPRHTMGEVVAEIHRMWVDSTATRRAGLLPDRLRYVADAVAALDLPDRWVAELTERCNVAITPRDRDSRIVTYAEATGTWTLHGPGDAVDRRTLQAVVEVLGAEVHAERPFVEPELAVAS